MLQFQNTSQTIDLKPWQTPEFASWCFQNKIPFSLKLEQRLFLWATEKGEEALVNALIDHPNVDPSMDSHRAVKKASYNGLFTVVKTVLNKKGYVLPGTDLDDVFNQACTQNYQELVQLYLDQSSSLKINLNVTKCFKEVVRLGFETLANTLGELKHSGVWSVKIDDNNHEALKLSPCETMTQVLKNLYSLRDMACPEELAGQFKTQKPSL